MKVQILDPKDNFDCQEKFVPVESFLSQPRVRETFNDIFRYYVHEESSYYINFQSYEVLGPVITDEDTPLASSSVLGKRTFPFSLHENYTPLAETGSESF